MSIKTSKRIALGVIASLVFAPFAAIAPASAANPPATSTVSLVSSSITTQAGSAATTVVKLIADAVAADEGAFTVTPSLILRPNGSNIAITAVDDTGAQGSTITGAGEFGMTLAGSEAPYVANDAMTNGVITVTDPATVGIQVTATATATGVGSLTVVPDVAGTYVIRVTVASTTPSTVDFTVIALPSTSNTTSITASVDKVSDVTGGNRLITVERNSLGSGTDGRILLQTISSANSASIGVGTTFGATTGVTAPITVGGTATTPTFTLDTTGFTAGSYVFRAFMDTNGDGAISAGELTSDITITVVAALLATTKIPVAIENSTRANVNGYQNFTVKVTANLPAGTVLDVAESAGDYTTIGDAGVQSTLTRVGATNTYIGNFSVKDAPTTTDFHDVEITVSATGFTSGTADLRVVRVGNVEATFKSIQVNDAVGIGSYDADGVRQALSAAGFAAATELTLDVDRTVVTQSYTITAAAGMEGRYLLVDLTRTPGTALSVLANSKSIVKIGADLEAVVSVTAVAPAANSATAPSGYSLTVTGGNGELKSTVTYRSATPRFVVSPSAGIEAKYADKISVTASLGDQFGRALADKDVSVVVTGRNAGTYPGKTDADGKFTFEWTDGSASTVILTDSVVFNYIYVAASTSTSTTTLASTAFVVTYSATGIEVGSVSVNAPTTTTDRPIDQSQVVTPHSSATVVYTATVKDADGSPVGEGALVTFTIGADDLTTGALTQVTDEFGKASITVYRQKAGTATVSATAGGVASNPSVAIKWVNKLRETADDTAVLTADYHARYVSLTADVSSSAPEGIIRFIAKVTDRFGNPVEGVQVTFSENGTGRFFQPPTSNQVDTNSLGEASIDMTTLKGEVGSMNVTVTITDTNSRQINDIAGFLSFTNATTTASATATVIAIPGLTAAVKSATATATVAAAAAPATPEVVVPPVAPSLTAERQGNRVLLFGSCMVDEGDMIIYVKSPGKAWSEKAKTLECAAGEYDGDIRGSKTTKFYRVKQEGTGLWSTSKLVRP